MDYPNKTSKACIPSTHPSMPLFSEYSSKSLNWNTSRHEHANVNT